MKLFKKVMLLSIVLIFIVSAYIWVQIPSDTEIKGCLITSMFEVDLCPQNKNYVPLRNISNYLQRTIILTEDSAFYTHHGFDSEGIEHCLEKMKEKGHIVCGGSTISQQLAKNMFLSKNKNFVRKGIEALITVKLENTLNKKEILEKYLNVVQFGKNIYGIKPAAAFYFKKSATDLDPVESAFLAMILPNPEKYSQSYFRKDLTKFARQRLSQIINNMYKYKSLNEEQYVSSLAKLDSFLQAGLLQKTDAEHSEILSEEEINEMVAEDLN